MTKPDRPHLPALRRRDLLQGAGALAMAAAVGRPARAQDGVTRLTFAFAPDDSGAIQGLLDAFNAAHRGEIEVNWRKMDRITDAYFRDLQSDFMAGAQEIDVFGADVIWTAELAAQDQIADLTGFAGATYPQGTFVEAAAWSTLYRNRVWAVPWYTDAGMLYYRKDLLAAAGFEQPPATWDELAEMATAVQAQTGTAHGFVFQGDSYEGGVTNALEFIWSAGGRPWTVQTTVAGALGMGQAVREPNVITLNSQDSAAGLDRARQLIVDGVAPEEVTELRERESLEIFGAGDAVFMRNWPFAYGILTTDSPGLTAEQIGVAPIPTLQPGGRSYSCLGGWNLAIAADSPRQEAARAFIRFATATEQQEAMARTGGFLPSLRSLYADSALVEAVPVVGLGETAVRHARARPASPIYSLLSPRLALMFERVLTGESSGAEAVSRTQTELRRIVQRYAY